MKKFVIAVVAIAMLAMLGSDLFAAPIRRVVVGGRRAAVVVGGRRAAVVLGGRRAAIVVGNRRANFIVGGNRRAAVIVQRRGIFINRGAAIRRIRENISHIAGLRPTMLSKRNSLSARSSTTSARRRRSACSISSPILSRSRFSGTGLLR